MSPQTLEQLGEIQTSLAPIAEDRSSTLRLIIHFVYSIFFSPGTLREALERLQRLLRTTSCCDGQLAMTFSAEPPAPQPGRVTRFRREA